MRLNERDALTRLAEHDHGVLSTLHPERGVDAVPVVYALDADGRVGIPVDTVKDKSSTRLRRERNLETDPRATLLVEHWDHDDWSGLWWVRAELRFAGVGAVDGFLADRLVARFPQYAERPFTRILEFRLGAVTGWFAGPRTSIST